MAIPYRKGGDNMRKENETELERRARITLKAIRRGRHISVEMFLPARRPNPDEVGQLYRLAGDKKATITSLWYDDGLGEKIRITSKK